MRRALPWLMCALLLGHAARARAAPQALPKTIAYLGATFIDVDRSSLEPDMAIVTQGARILAIQPAADFHASAGQQTVQVRGKFIIPGLINTHVHLATLAQPRAARAYLRRELYSGVTAVRDMAGDARLLAELKREAALDEIVAPDIYFTALMAGPDFFADPRTHDAARGEIAGQVPWMQAVTAQTDLQLAVAEARGTGASAIKLYADMNAELVKAITAEAHRQHLLVWAHADVFPARPSEVVEAGVDVISHACLLGYQLADPPVPAYHQRVPVDAAKVGEADNPALEALYEDIKRHGTILDATLYPYDTDRHPSTCPAGIEDVLTKQAHRAGVLISTGTDDDFDWRDPDSALDREFEFLVQRAGMTPAEVIRSATLIGARAAGIEKDAGTLEVGKQADFVVLQKNPLLDIANMRSVLMVVKHGIAYPRSRYQPASAASLKVGTP